jgi:hypothetical protein
MARVAPTIPSATIKGGDPELTISDDSWRRIEDAYGSELTADVREQIRDATLSFLRFVEAEQAAQAVSISRARVAQVKKAAAEFQEAVFENPQDSTWDARNYADRLIKRCFHDARIADFDGPRWLGTLMISLVVACNQALAHLDDPKNQDGRKGETWENWIRRLTAMLETRGLPKEVRKDADKNKTGKPSPFVGLVRELQTCIPAAFRRPIQSDNALSEAIYRARRPRRDKNPPGAVGSQKPR